MTSYLLHFDDEQMESTTLTEAAALAQSTPEEFRLGCWACQDMLTVDVAPRRGPRSENGELFVPNEPGLGFAPDEALLGDPVAVYDGK